MMSTLFLILLASDPGVVASEFVFDAPPTPSCHAATLAEGGGSIVAAWFGGTEEGAKDVGIWSSRRQAGRWTRPVEVATGAEGPTRHPCWNPVLYQAEGGPLLLFYKVGPSPRTWWGMLKTSHDGGRTWSDPGRLPDGILGPIKNKPIRLGDGALLCPSSTEDGPGWRAHLEETADLGRNWTRTAPIGDGKSAAIIQPTLLATPGGLLILCRSRQGRIFESRSADDGLTWSPPVATPLPNPNSGIDAVGLGGGKALLVYNRAKSGRSPLNVALTDDGATWRAGPVLESGPGEFSYPAVIRSADGLVHVAYTYNRLRIKHVVLDPARIEAGGELKP